MKRRWGLDEVTPFEMVRTLDPEPDPYVLDRAQTAVAQAFPLFRDMVVAERWAGMIDVMPDAIPVISPVDRVPGFFIATGFSGHGFGIGHHRVRQPAPMQRALQQKGPSSSYQYLFAEMHPQPLRFWEILRSGRDGSLH